MKKLLLLSAFLVFACSSEEKFINASSLQEKDGKTMYLGEVFSGYAAYKGRTAKWIKGFKYLKKGNICQLLIKYKNGKIQHKNYKSTSDSMYQMACCSKFVTSIIVAKLYELGKLDYTTDINKYLKVLY